MGMEMPQWDADDNLSWNEAKKGAYLSQESSWIVGVGALSAVRSLLGGITVCSMTGARCTRSPYQMVWIKVLLTYLVVTAGMAIQ